MKILRFSLALAAVVLASAILLSTSFVKADRDRDDDDAHKGSPTPPGLFITPTALKDAVQQDLKPGFALPYFATNYPDYVAGEAVKAVVSPDGKILAILTAGFNSLSITYVGGPPATVDTAASTQFIFLYNVSGPTRPSLSSSKSSSSSIRMLVWSGRQTARRCTRRAAATTPYMPTAKQVPVSFKAPRSVSAMPRTAASPTVPTEQALA